MSQAWYFVADSERHGPVTLEDLTSLIRSGRLGQDSLVWRNGLPSWVRVNEMPDLARVLADIPPPLPNPSRSGASSTSPPPQIADDSTQAIKPWHRFWARCFDYVLFGFVFGIGSEIAGVPLAGVNDLLLNMLVAFAWVPIEAVLLSIWGRTPGKGLFRIRVTDDVGARLGFLRALERALRVWFAGIGLGFPLIGLITQWHQYRTLVAERAATYDRDQRNAVHHESIGPARWVLIAITGAIVVGLIVLGTLAEQEGSQLPGGVVM